MSLQDLKESLKGKTVSSKINPLMDMVDEGKLAGTGASRYNELGMHLDRELYKAIKDIYEDTVAKHGPIDIRMFMLVVFNAGQDVALERLF